MLELHGLLGPIETRVTNAVPSSGTDTVGLGAMIANAVLFVLSLITRPFVLAFEVLMRRESQRAEYLADSIAADVAGRDAARSLLRTLHLTPSLIAGARTLAVRGESEDVFGVMRRRVADTPEREWQRLDRVMEMEETQLDSTHPPTAERIRVIDGRPLAVPMVVLDAQQREALDRELLAFEPAYARRLFELARDSLYWH
jgi:Zn-dependent protease with chaperone function